MFRIKVLFLITIIFLFAFLEKSIGQQHLPELGAEIFIEPGQTPQEVENWVKLLSEADMPVARVFMMWNYLEPKPGVWDFKLYDTLFSAAEKYGVKISVTLVPNQPPFFWGKDFFYYTHNMYMYSEREYKERSEIYIKKVVERYNNSPALDSWWLYNEPNGYPVNSPFAMDEFRKWLETRYESIDSLNEAWQSYFTSFQGITYDERWMEGGHWVWQTAFYDWCEFWKENINNQIDWLKKEVEVYDKKHPFTTNPPGVFTSLAHYDLPEMEKVVNILGASLHPSWNFSWVPKHRYGLAVSWINGLLHGVSEERPYWISELQGGSNWHSEYPLDPSPDDIAKWVWTSIGGGADRIIFWLLNPRMQGQESTEWSLLNFQQHPSDRMKMAAKIAEIIKDNKNEFEGAKSVETPISIIVSPQTLLTQERKYKASPIAAVSPLRHQKAAMACYNALMERGIQVQIKLTDDYDWKTNKKNQIAILPDVTVLTEKEIGEIKAFVRNGNKIIVSGLTGLYNKDEKSWIVNQKFPLQDVLGGTVKDILSDSIRFTVNIDKKSLPAQLIYSEILPKGGTIIGRYKAKPIAIENNYGEGTAVWIPSLIAVGAWVYGDEAFSNLLGDEVNGGINKVPFRFAFYSKNCYMETLKSNDAYITIIVNESRQKKTVHLLYSLKKKAKLLYGTGWDDTTHLLTMYPNSTVVLGWE
jgi:beta-galactosidase